MLRLRKVPARDGSLHKRGRMGISGLSPGKEPESVVRYLHTMIRVTDPDATIAFFALIGLKEVRRIDNAQARFTLIFLAPPGQEDAQVELTWNWPAEDGTAEAYSGGRNFGHLAFQVDDIYATCAALLAAGHIVHRPPRDGHMAFVKTPDGISVELLQDGQLPPAEPWVSMPNFGSW
jgi:lactoylglutathione lyase